jgi:amidohydrolase
MNIPSSIQKLVPEMTDWRHYLHRHPETAFEENITAGFVADRLKSFGLDVATGIGITGVVGTLRRGDGDPEPIALRADFDALDIEEENDLNYRSEHPGKMHACGHDGHTAMLLGAAKYLSESDIFRGTVHFIFQPAEENEGGAKKMVDDGLFDRFPCRAVYGLHNFPILPEGYFALRKGPAMAAFDIFEILLKGTGSHAAMPHIAKDPVVAAAYLVTMFQSIVGRNVNPVESAVVSVTDIHGGSTYNVIPETVRLRGTTRHFLPGIQDLVESRIREISAGLASSMGIDIDVRYERRYPPVVNTDREVDEAVAAASAVASPEKVITAIPPLMGSEDFAFMLKEKPGAYIGLGAGAPRENGMLHQPGYDFNDALLPIGASYWAALVKSLLPK